VKSEVKNCFQRHYFSRAAPRPAWINDLQGVWLESGVFIGS
jgi:hypothetical protein